MIGGVQQKVHYMVIDLPHSDACFVKAYPGETMEAFCDAHAAAFAFFGGIPLSILYDNTTLAVTKIKKEGKRDLTEEFTRLQSHYLFDTRFGRPAKGNDKGKVEGMVGFIRRNYLVPIPRFASFDALNAHLEEECLKRQGALLRGHEEDIEQRFVRDLDALMTLTAAPFDACKKKSTRANSVSLVRFHHNDYSVPVAYAHHEVQVRGYVHEVIIGCGAEVIARDLTEEFTRLQSHYLFDTRFGRPAKGNDKGKVEGMVGFIRRNYLVPIPRFASFDALNAHLEEECLKRQGALLRGHEEDIEQRFVRDLDALMTLTAAPFDACKKKSTRANSVSLVRFHHNDYSVPVAYAHHEVQVRGYVHEVIIGCGAEVIARHERSYEKADFIFDPMHYLPLRVHLPG